MRFAVTVTATLAVAVTVASPVIIRVTALVTMMKLYSIPNSSGRGIGKITGISTGNRTGDGNDSKPVNVTATVAVKVRSRVIVLSTALAPVMK